MDSDIDFSLDDTLAAPGYDDRAANKFKPKARGRNRSRSTVVASTRPTVESVNSTPLVLDAHHENLFEVNDLSPSNGANPVGDGDSDRLNNLDEAHLRVSGSQVGLVSTEPLAVSQEAVTTGDGISNGDLLEELAVNGSDGCPIITVEEKSNVMESDSLQCNPFDDIDLGQPTSFAKDTSGFRPKLKSRPLKQTFNSAESGCLEEDVPLDDTGRVGIQISSIDVDLDPAQFNDVNSEEIRPQQKSFSDTTRNDNEKQNSGGTTESCGLFNSDLLGAPSVFPPASDYFSVNQDSTYTSAVGGPSATLPNDDMQVETGQGITSEWVDDCVPAEGNGTRKPPRAPRKRKAPSTHPSVVNRENDVLQGEHCGGASVGPDASNNNIDGDANLKKKCAKRSRKSAPDGVKQTRRRKKTNETSSEQSEKPKKEFSRSTRGRRKPVDPVLLATPDDEIDLTTVPLKDLIHRAEILERDSKKAPTPSSTPPVVERYESPSRVEETIYGWHNFESDQPEHEYQSDDCNMEVQEASSYFNYHSYMKKTPRVKWTKLDTELFYQGIRQFGTDFTLIQQHHFPGRTRDQIKSKYKKEEREQPVRLTEAIENKAVGVSHYQQVIEQLTAAEAQEIQDLDEAEANEDNIPEASAELFDSYLERHDEDDVMAKDVADMQEVEKMDDYDEVESGISYKSL